MSVNGLTPSLPPNCPDGLNIRCETTPKNGGSTHFCSFGRWLRGWIGRVTGVVLRTARNSA